MAYRGGKRNISRDTKHILFYLMIMIQKHQHQTPCTPMESVFSLPLAARTDFIHFLVQSFGCSYICLWALDSNISTKYIHAYTFIIPYVSYKHNIILRLLYFCVVVCASWMVFTMQETTNQPLVWGVWHNSFLGSSGH